MERGCQGKRRERGRERGVERREELRGGREGGGQGKRKGEGERLQSLIDEDLNFTAMYQIYCM